MIGWQRERLDSRWSDSYFNRTGRKSSTKNSVLEKIPPPKPHFPLLITAIHTIVLCPYCSKTIGFAQQFAAISTAIRHPLPCKTIGFAVQNDRFYTVEPCSFLHKRSGVERNVHTLSYLRLHTHTCQKTDRGIYFSFYCHSQSV